MEALWFVLGFAVTTTVVLATEKLIIKINLEEKYVWTYYGTYNKSSGRNVCNRCRNCYYTSLHRYKAEEKKMIEIFTPDDILKSRTVTLPSISKIFSQIF